MRGNLKLGAPLFVFAGTLAAGGGCRSGVEAEGDRSTPPAVDEASVESFAPVVLEVSHRQPLYLRPSLDAPALARHASASEAEAAPTGKIMLLEGTGRRGSWLRAEVSGCALGGPTNARYEVWVPLKGAVVAPGAPPPTCELERFPEGVELWPAGELRTPSGLEVGRLVGPWAVPPESRRPAAPARRCATTGLGLIDADGWRALELCVD